MMMRNTKANM